MFGSNWQLLQLKVGIVVNLFGHITVFPFRIKKQSKYNFKSDNISSAVC